MEIGTDFKSVKITLNIFAVQAASYVDTSIRALSWNNYIACSRMIKSFYLWNFLKTLIIQSNLAIRNFLVALKLFLDVKIFLSLWSKWQIGHRKWFINTNLFIIKQFFTAKFDCTLKCWVLNCISQAISIIVSPHCAI